MRGIPTCTVPRFSRRENVERNRTLNAVRVSCAINDINDHKKTRGPPLLIVSFDYVSRLTIPSSARFICFPTYELSTLQSMHVISGYGILILMRHRQIRVPSETNDGCDR